VPGSVAAAGGARRRLAGRIADGALLRVSPQELPEAIAHVREGEREASKPTAATRILLWTTVAVDEDAAVARAAVRGAVARRAMNTLGRRQQLAMADSEALSRLQAVYDTQRQDRKSVV